MKNRIEWNEKMGKRGFTLIELLIVVIILAVLAAIVIPQFSSSTKDAQESALDTNLTEMRNAVELYYHQHGSVYPAFVGDGTNAAETEATLLSQLTRYTAMDGAVSDTKDATNKYGPYLKKQELPTNPIDGNTNWVFNATNKRC
jgi:general secretion pathway protein G